MQRLHRTPLSKHSLPSFGHLSHLLNLGWKVLLVASALWAASSVSIVLLAQAAQAGTWIEENERGDELDEGLPPPARQGQGQPSFAASPSWLKKGEERRARFWRSFRTQRKPAPRAKRPKEYWDPDE